MCHCRKALLDLKTQNQELKLRLRQEVRSAQQEVEPEEGKIEEECDQWDGWDSKLTQVCIHYNIKHSLCTDCY